MTTQTPIASATIKSVPILPSTGPCTAAAGDDCGRQQGTFCSQMHRMVVATELVVLWEQTQTTVQWDRVMMVVQKWMLARRRRGYQLMQQRIVPSGVITVIGICIPRVINIIIIIMLMMVRSCRSRVVMVGMVVVVVVVKAIEVVM